jgi:uncharacterized protein YkwD
VGSVRRIAGALVATLLCAALLLVAASPAGAIGDRQSAVAAYQSTVADDAVPRGWTGSTEPCTIGTESQASIDATRHTLNVVRDFAGLGPVQFTAEKNHRALAAALMMEANGELNHDPPNSWKCYSDEGALGARTSNLALGATGASAILAYADDSGVASLGHRRWVLDPGEVEMGTGSTNGANALVVFNSPSDPGPGAAVPADSVVAWPAPGFFPEPWMFGDWSVAIGNDVSQANTDVTNAQVSVTIDGKDATVSGVRDLSQDPSTGSIGTGKTLSWQVSPLVATMTGDHEIKVKITGVTMNGNPMPISYSLTAFDPNSAGNPPGGVEDKCAKAKAKLKKAKKHLRAVKKDGSRAQVKKAKKKVAKAKKRKRKACAK